MGKEGVEGERDDLGERIREVFSGEGIKRGGKRREEQLGRYQLEGLNS